MGRLLQRLRRLLGQNAIRLSVDDLPAELRPVVRLHAGDRLEIGPRRFRVGEPIPASHPPRVALLDDRVALLDDAGPDDTGADDTGADDTGADDTGADDADPTWSGRIEGSELVLSPPEGESIRLPLRTVLHYPVSDGSSPEEP
jgi:hypothetical protein